MKYNEKEIESEIASSMRREYRQVKQDWRREQRSYLYGASMLSLKSDTATFMHQAPSHVKMVYAIQSGLFPQIENFS